jgi:hypothetical protein
MLGRMRGLTLAGGADAWLMLDQGTAAASRTVMSMDGITRRALGTPKGPACRGEVPSAGRPTHVDAAHARQQGKAAGPGRRRDGCRDAVHGHQEMDIAPDG